MEEAGHSSLAINRTCKGKLTRHTMSGCKMKRIPAPLGRSQRIIWEKGGIVIVLVCECYQVWKLLHMLDQVKTATCSGNQNTAGGNGVYVSERTSITIRQSVRGVYRKQPPFWSGSSLWDRQQSCLELSLLHISLTLNNLTNWSQQRTWILIWKNFVCLTSIYTELCHSWIFGNKGQKRKNK